ncbi:MAG: Phr family secreted Rap phosphatase inhibitor [Oscillospiraceae bacterium]|nr:Phr family secreted Rap phosphatase inhibitor [Oscillospiraceae bacterium]
MKRMKYIILALVILLIVCVGMIFIINNQRK